MSPDVGSNLSPDTGDPVQWEDSSLKTAPWFLDLNFEFVSKVPEFD